MIPVLLGRPRFRPRANVNLIVDGNSIYADVGGTPVDQCIMALEPWASSGASHANVAISGQSWANMTNNASDVDGAYQAGAINVLVCGETTNSANLTGAEIWANAMAYISGRKTAHPDLRVVLCGSIPRYDVINSGAATVAGWNANMLAFDSLARAGWKAAGADAFVDFRTPLTPCFNHDGSQAAYFTDYSWAWYEGTGYQLHPTTAGKMEKAKAIVATIHKMSA